MTKKEFKQKMVYHIISEWRASQFHRDRGDEQLARDLQQRVVGLTEFARMEYKIDPSEIMQEVFNRMRAEDEKKGA